MCVHVYFSTVGLVLVQQPSNQLASVGDTVTFMCSGSGSDPISYEWLKDGSIIVDSDGRVNGTNSTTLTINTVQSDDYGNYSCRVNNTVNSVLSDAALLTGNSLYNTVCYILYFLTILSIQYLQMWLP